jgi:hypothetical protein
VRLETRPSVGQAPGADELLDDPGALVGVWQQVDGLDAKAVGGEQVLPQPEAKTNICVGRGR